MLYKIFGPESQSVTNLVAIPPHGLLHHTTAAHQSTSDYNSHHSLHLRRTHSQLIALIIHCTDHTAAPHHPLYISFGLHLIHGEVFYNEEAVSLEPNAALVINKRRSDRQGSETVTGVTKTRQNQQQEQCKGRGRRQTERISNGRQGQKADSKRSESYRQSR